MYSEFFGLRTDPFAPCTDDQTFFASTVHGQALNNLIHSLKFKSGLILVLGKVGSGKTTLCAYAQSQLKNNFLIANLNNPLLSTNNWLREINTAFGFSTPLKDSTNYILKLKENLASCLDENQKPVLFIDEGHLLSTGHLEQLLVLCNLQFPNRANFSIVLCALPELEENLALHGLIALKQRIWSRIHLPGLNYTDTLRYIEHRLVLSNSNNTVLFSPQAVRLIWKKSKGNPRLINHICSRSLEIASLNHRARINSLLVRKALKEPEVINLISTPNLRLKLLLPVSALTVIILFFNFSLLSPDKNFSGNGNTKPEIDSVFKQKQYFNLKAQEDKFISMLKSLGREIALLREQTPYKQDHDSTFQPNKQNKNNTSQPGQKKQTSQTADHLEDLIPTDLGSDLVIQAIVWSHKPEGRIAVINDRIFSQGEMIKDIKIKKIHQKSVEFEKSGLIFYKKMHKDKS